MLTAWRMKALCLAGRIILENGGETYRAEETVIHMGQALGMTEVDVFAIPSGLFISCTDENGERQTSVSRVFLRSTRLARVDAVNRISRSLSDGSLKNDELMDRLTQAQHLGENIGSGYEPLMAFITAAGFSVVFGGKWIDMLVGGLCSALTILIPRLLRKQDTGSMTSVLVSGLLCSFISLLFSAVTGLGIPEAMIAAALMPLLPGLSMTNAVQDILRGDMVSGVAHAARASMVAALLAGGTLIGTHLFAMTGLHTPVNAVLMFASPAAEALVLFVTSVVAAGGFGAFLYAPRKAILWGSILGASGYLIYWLCLQSGMAETVSIFLGTLVACSFAQLSARKMKMIATVFVTIAIVPVVPGLGLYRAMSAIAAGQTAEGSTIAAHTMALILMMAMGMALGSALFGRHQRPER